MYVDVLVEIRAKRIDKTFTYLVPKELEDKIKIGIRVLVPFGSQTLEGFVLNIKNGINIDYEIKEIKEVIDLEPVLNSEMLELGKYISKKTLCNLIHAYQTMLPSALKAHAFYTVNKKYITYIKLLDNSYTPKNDNQKELYDYEVIKENLVKIEALKEESYNFKLPLLKFIK